MKWQLILPFLASVATRSLVPGTEAKTIEYLRAFFQIPSEDAAILAAASLQIEALAAAFLLWPRTFWLGCIIVTGLATAYAIMHAFALLVGDAAPCPCGGLNTAASPVIAHLLMGAFCITMTVIATRLALAPPRKNRFQGEPPCVS